MPKGGVEIVPIFVKDGEVAAEKEEVKAESEEIVLTIGSMIASVFGEFTTNDLIARLFSVYRGLMIMAMFRLTEA